MSENVMEIMTIIGPKFLFKDSMSSSGVDVSDALLTKYNFKKLLCMYVMYLKPLYMYVIFLFFYLFICITRLF